MRSLLLVGTAAIALLAYPVISRATGIPVVDAALVTIQQNESLQAMWHRAQVVADWVQQAADMATTIENQYEQIARLEAQLSAIQNPQQAMQVLSGYTARQYLPDEYADAAGLANRGLTIAGGNWGTLSGAARSARQLGGMLDKIPDPNAPAAQDYDRVANIHAAQRAASEQLYNSIHDHREALELEHEKLRGAADPKDREVIQANIALIESTMAAEQRRYDTYMAGLDAERRLAEDAARQRSIAAIQDTQLRTVSW